MVAINLLKQREGEIAQGKTPSINFEKVTFDELAHDFLQHYRISGRKSLDRAERSVKKLNVFFEGVRIPYITTPRINTYIEARQEVASNATINRELSALKTMFNLGIKQTPSKVSRVPHIPMLKENNIRRGFFENEHFLALREALPEYLKGFVTFAYKTGWRVSEITGLKWAHIDRQKRTVRLEAGETKNDKGRILHLDDELVQIIEHKWNKRKEKGVLAPYVFPNRRSTGRIRDFRFVWKKACERSGIGYRIFHDFRRTAVRNMIRAGVPEAVAMKISGHKTRTVFDRYNIVDEKDLKNATLMLENYIEKQNGQKKS